MITQKQARQPFDNVPKPTKSRNDDELINGAQVDEEVPCETLFL